MRQSHFRRIALLLLLACLSGCNYLDPRKRNEFHGEIEAFKRKDELNPPPKSPILFIGSSSVRLWTSVDTVFKRYGVINRGFGGAKLRDIYAYLDEVVFKYHPRQIIMYCGDNDIAFENVDAETVFSRFKKVYEGIREELPEVPFVYMSIKASPGRVKFLPVQKKANQLIKSYLQTQKHTRFVNIFPLMIDSLGNPRKDIVGPDSVHMNRKGYAVWEVAMEPYLLK